MHFLDLPHNLLPQEHLPQKRNRCQINSLPAKLRTQYGIVTAPFFAAICAPSASRTTMRTRYVPGLMSKLDFTVKPVLSSRVNVGSSSFISRIFSPPVMKFPFSSKIAVANVMLSLLGPASLRNRIP